MEKRGITFKMKTAVEDIADIDADVILMATGRRPRTPGYTNVDDNFRVVGVSDGSPSGIYAIGDVNGRQMLAHAAEMQAVRAVNHILGRTDNIRFDIMPAAIFTDPEAACVGPTEDALKASSVPVASAAGYICHKAFWRANGKALAMNETDGMLKLFTTPLSPPSPITPNPSPNDSPGLILGCHAYGAHSADIVQEVSVLMCKHTTIAELADMVHIHPTLSEILKTAVD
jgi:dihydrolipoamide dehydrogenase